MRGNKGQIALFVIIAIFLVATISLGYFFVKGQTFLPSKLAPVEDKIGACIREAIEQGTALSGEQGGYIETPEFEAGSEIYPSTSQLNFFGSIIPYWYYISGNGMEKSQAPSLTAVENQLNRYIQDSLAACDFKEFEDQGFTISSEEAPKTITSIKSGYIQVDSEWPITMSIGGTTRRVASHSVRTESNFRALYETAKQIYDRESSELFLEKYTLDSISLYAPTTDVALTCAPMVWSKAKVMKDIKDALSVNLPSIKFSGNYYDLNVPENKYFVKELDKSVVNQQVNVIYDLNLPTYIEIYPSEKDIMRSDPIGLQEGLGALGFCYVPYHFVYSMNYPVIIQVFDDKFNLFQFSTVVVVRNNLPRNSTVGEQPEDFSESVMCQNKVQDFEVRTVNKYGETLDADIKFKCGGALCSIGETKDGELKTLFPQCVNGFMVAQKEGYAPAKAQVSTDVEGSIEIPMKKIYSLNLSVFGDNYKLRGNESAMLMISSPDYSANAYYPFQKSIDLIEGNYEIQGYLFKDGKITLSAQSNEKCIDVPRSGILGFMGFKREECFNLDMPSQELSQIISGGGKSEISFDEEQLKDATEIRISMPLQPLPKSVEDLQGAYDRVDAGALDIQLA